METKQKNNVKINILGFESTFGTFRNEGSCIQWSFTQ